MLKLLPKILIIIFFSVFIIQLAGLIFLLAAPEISQAADIQYAIDFKPQVGIDTTFQKDTAYAIPKDTKAIGEYIKSIYKYAIGAVGILAAVVLMFGGIIWITAGGSAERIGEAKAWITASLTGLILALCSYMILYTVNPNLVNFKITPVKTVEGTGCCIVNGIASNTAKTACKGSFTAGATANASTNTCISNTAADTTTGCCAYGVVPTCQNTSYTNCKSLTGSQFFENMTCSTNSAGEKVCYNKQSEECLEGLFYVCWNSSQQEDLLDEGIYAKCDNTICEENNCVNTTPNCNFNNKFCYTTKVNGAIYGCDLNECNYLPDGSTCKTPLGENGFCTNKECGTCRATGVACDGWLSYNYQCCNGDCLYGSPDDLCN
ncbi:pilin [Candidatus Parcubacteria bacterium]|nr:pilin [Candidatus Parcubacteria bacterium]